MAEVHLGLNDKVADAPDNGCRADDKFDGGVEYWLIERTQTPAIVGLPNFDITLTPGNCRVREGRLSLGG